jgi:hypothetical protein
VLQGDAREPGERKALDVAEALVAGAALTLSQIIATCDQ